MSRDCIIDKEKIGIVSYFIKALGPQYFYELELQDPQLISLKTLRTKCMGKEFYELVIGASLIAYRLRRSGEDFWAAFSQFEHYCEDPYFSLESYIIKERELARNAKIRRVRTLREKRGLLLKRLDRYFEDLGLLYKDLMKIFGNRYQKTVSFACKMFHYAMIVDGRHGIVPMDIPIPLDSRVRRITQKLGIVGKSSDHECYLKAWKLVSDLSGIDQMHLDVFLWRKLHNAV
ncbi:MAG: N-glycosylase/DNA lyase [Nitrososphaeria archaeon]